MLTSALFRPHLGAHVPLRRYRERFGATTASGQQAGDLMHELNQFCWDNNDRSLQKTPATNNGAGVTPQAAEAPVAGGGGAAVGLTSKAAAAGAGAVAASVTPQAAAVAAAGTGAGEVSVVDAPARKPMPDDFLDTHLLTFTLFGVVADKHADEDISLEASDGPSGRKVKTEDDYSDDGSSTEAPSIGSAPSLKSVKGVTALAGAADVLSRRKSQQLARAARIKDGASEFKRKLVNMVDANARTTNDNLAELKALNHQIRRNANIEQHKAVMAELRAELQDAEDDGDDAGVMEAKTNIKKQRKMFREYIKTQPLTDTGAATSTAPAPAPSPAATSDHGAASSPASSKTFDAGAAFPQAGASAPAPSLHSTNQLPATWSASAGREGFAHPHLPGTNAPSLESLSASPLAPPMRAAHQPAGTWSASAGGEGFVHRHLPGTRAPSLESLSDSAPDWGGHTGRQLGRETFSSHFSSSSSLDLSQGEDTACADEANVGLPGFSRGI